MAFVKKDRVRESTSSTGTGPFTLLGAANGYQSFGSVLSIGDTTQGSISQPGGSWLTGLFTYSALNTITVTTIYESSNGGAAVTWGAGTKDIFITLPASQAAVIPAGTAMGFFQTAAPVGWTKQTTHNDKVLRVVSGTASSGGTNSFSSVMAANGSVIANTTITQSTMASHTHTTTYPIPGGGSTFNDPGTGAATNATVAGPNTGSIGGDGPHNHSITLAIQYVDLIIATRDA
jgi:hypothetical protein